MTVQQSDHVRQVERRVVVIVLHYKYFVVLYRIQRNHKIFTNRMMCKFNVCFWHIFAGKPYIAVRLPPDILGIFWQPPRTIWFLTIIYDNPLIGLHGLRGHPSITKKTKR
jgi:hypothetical protein